MQVASHFTDLSRAWSMQLKDLPPNPKYYFGGVLVIGRDVGHPDTPPIQPRFQQPIVQKRNTDDLEKIRQMLAGLLKRPAGQPPAGQPPAAGAAPPRQ